MRYIKQTRLNGEPTPEEMCDFGVGSLMVSIAWILILVGAAFGLQVGEPSAGNPATAASSNLKWLERYGRKVFDERRRRYIEAYPDSYVARELATTTRPKDANSDGGYMAYSSSD
jgi:hypothetical protein